LKQTVDGISKWADTEIDPKGHIDFLVGWC
jgi:hypothetical protein